MLKMWLQAREVVRGAETVLQKGRGEKAEGQDVVWMKGVGLEGKGMKKEEVVAGGDHREPYLLNEEPRPQMLSGRHERRWDDTGLWTEKDKIIFPGHEMKRQGWRQEEGRRNQGCECGSMGLDKNDGGLGRSEWFIRQIVD